MGFHAHRWGELGFILTHTFFPPSPRYILQWNWFYSYKPSALEGDQVALTGKASVMMTSYLGILLGYYPCPTIQNWEGKVIINLSQAKIWQTGKVNEPHLLICAWMASLTLWWCVCVCSWSWSIPLYWIICYNSISIHSLTEWETFLMLPFTVLASATLQQIPGKNLIFLKLISKSKTKILHWHRYSDPLLWQPGVIWIDQQTATFRSLQRCFSCSHSGLLSSNTEVSVLFIVLTRSVPGLLVWD